MEPSLFAQTVLARQFRRPRLRWGWLSLLLRHWLPSKEFPVSVVDFSPADNRWAAGFPAVCWSPIPGCDNPSIARRRAEALLHGVRQGNTGSQDDKFFHDSAAEVLSAWLHAAALDHREIADLINWLENTDDPVPRRILATHPAADKAASLAIVTHLDKAAERTTSGVKRYLVLAVSSLASRDGRALIGNRHSDRINLVEHIQQSGTIYVLADETQIDSCRPLLGLFIDEVYAAAQAVALRSGRKRLDVPFVGIHDELRYGPPVPRLPYVANTGRKFNLLPIYAVQGSGQEVEAYGDEATALRAAAGVTIIGGLDIDSAPELSDRAGLVPVVTASRSTADAGESIQVQNVLTTADQQRLKDGESVVSVRGLSPFLARTDSYRAKRRRRRRIDAEAAQVQRRVDRENRRTTAWHTAATAAGDALSGFSDPTGGDQ
nr:type IV secretion system DNA-binding domain-containing protein [Kibdelosporangium phytohabitans]